MTEWQLVPKQPTPEMLKAAFSPEAWRWLDERGTEEGLYAAMLAAAPKPPSDTLTKAEAAQQWRGMDGATAWHLIDRHADGWADVGEMMDAWLAANKAAP